MCHTHSLSPRNGRHIHFTELVSVIRKKYSLSYLLSIVLTFGGFITSGCKPKFTLKTLGFTNPIPMEWTIDLGDLAKHNGIEHDGSLAHPDTPSWCDYAGVAPDWPLLKRLIWGTSKEPGNNDDPNNPTSIPDGTITIHNLTLARARRDTEISIPLSRIHTEITHGEVVFINHALANKAGDIPIRSLYQFMIEERFPDGWTGPLRSIGLFKAAKESGKVEKEVETLRRCGIQ